MDNKSSNQEQHWKQCPQGVLQRVADRTAKRESGRKSPGGSNQFDRRRMLQIAAAIVVTTGAGTVAYQSLFPRVEHTPFPRAHSDGYGGINCREFLKNMEAYIEKGLDDQKLIAAMDEHLRLCEPCQAKYNSMRDAQT